MLVDDQRQVYPVGLHLFQQRGGRHGLWHVQHLALELAQQGPGLGLSAIGHQAEDVLDVDDPDRIVERLAINRQAAVFGLDEAGDDLIEGGVDLDGLDIGPRGHHVADVEPGELAGVPSQLIGGRRLRGVERIVLAKGPKDLAQHAAQTPSTWAPATSRGRV